jgi:hypothetical protein
VRSAGDPDPRHFRFSRLPPIVCAIPGCFVKKGWASHRVIALLAPLPCLSARIVRVNFSNVRENTGPREKKLLFSYFQPLNSTIIVDLIGSMR